MRNSCLLICKVFAFFLLFASAGCLSPDGEDLRMESRLQKMYLEKRGSPSEYRAKLIEDPYWVRRREQLLGGTLAMDRSELRAALKRYEKEIEIGRAWKSPLFHVKIPFTSKTPVLDGTPEPKEWENALRFRGDYLLNSTVRHNDETVWLLQYDREYLYFAAVLPDREIRPGPADKPYLGDCTELFLLPDYRLTAYLETIVSASGGLYTAWGTQSRNRHYDLERRSIPGVQAASMRFPGGYAVEVRIPFSTLPGYLLGNQPKKGDPMNFMMIRCDLQEKNHNERSTPVPFLYDGHNIYGYIRGTLE